MIEIVYMITHMIATVLAANTASGNIHLHPKLGSVLGAAKWIQLMCTIAASRGGKSIGNEKIY